MGKRRRARKEPPVEPPVEPPIIMDTPPADPPATMDTAFTDMENVRRGIFGHMDYLKTLDVSLDTISQFKNFIDNGSKLLLSLRSQADALESILGTCTREVDALETALTTEVKKEDYVYLTNGGMLSYAGKDTIEPAKDPAKERQNTYISEIDYEMKLRHVQDLKDIPSALHYYAGAVGSKHTPGIYLNLHGNYVRVPFPRVTDSNKDASRYKTIKCKYGSAQECLRYRSRFSGPTRSCNFAHRGDVLLKVGHISRCASMPGFGDPNTILEDIPNVSVADAKNLMLYGLSDLMTTIVFMDVKGIKDVVFDRLEYV